MPYRFLSFAVLLSSTLVPACAFGLAQGPDRPDPGDTEGPPPPAAFHCERGERRLESVERSPGPARVVHVLGSGAVICRSEDRNHDGKIDAWLLLQDGRIVEQAMDTDFDGKLDLHSPALAPAVERNTDAGVREGVRADVP